MCLPTAIGCQLLEAETSVRRRFWGSSKRQAMRLTVRGRYIAFGVMPNVSVGSQCERLDTSKCCPLFARSPTWLGGGEHGSKEVPSSRIGPTGNGAHSRCAGSRRTPCSPSRAVMPRRHAGRRHRDADHGMIGSPGARRKLRYETACRLARPSNRPCLWISDRDAARKLHCCSRAVQQRTEPSDAALHGRQSLGRALQGGQDARPVNLLSAQRSGCSQTGPAGRCAPFRRCGPRSASGDALGA